MWFEKCDSDLFFAWNFLRRFVLVIMLDQLIVNFSDRLISLFDEWRMLILDYRMTYVCSRSVERRMSVLDLSSNVCLSSTCRTTFMMKRHLKLDETFHQIHCERLINLDKSDSLNLMNENVISSNLTRTTYQIWRRKRHFIKLNERVISSNFLKRETIFLFFDEQFLKTFDVKNLILQNSFFVRR
jgi:hypothetical protein